LPLIVPRGIFSNLIIAIGTKLEFKFVSFNFNDYTWE